ncbi:MAG: 50S ribosomal protein L11 methyltransferase [Clostridiales Family XIII bacterium]|jgi:ribosomal protein L11 methyltransferase|nr:50S ribosomal protein L11 methyltransferase [Clostridiales Family XIII bacterium]
MEYIEAKVYGSSEGIALAAEVFAGHGIVGAAIEDPADVADLLAHKNEYSWDYFDEALSASGSASGKKEAVASFYIEHSAAGAALLEAVSAEIARLKAEDAGTPEGGSRKGGEKPEGRGGGMTEGSEGGGTPESGEGAGTPEGGRFGSLAMESRVCSDSEWKDNWKEFFKPKRIGRRLVVKPHWEPWDRKEGDIVIEIDPGMAFGTGRHETTELCARFLEEAVAPGCKVFDVGCGSGILSIAAALLGAGDVLACDIDEDAVAVARGNIAANGCEGRVRAINADLNKGIQFEADIAVANLTAELIAALVGMLKNSLKPGGAFIASGVLAEKGGYTAEALSAAGFEIERRAADGEWCAFLARLPK